MKHTISIQTNAYILRGISLSVSKLLEKLVNGFYKKNANEQLTASEGIAILQQIEQRLE